MKRWITKGLVVASVFLPQAYSPAEEMHDKNYPRDPRLHRLKAFFQRRECPVQRYAADFLFAADKHQLDWRLLPSIALVESSGGKVYTNNNIFGWDSCKRRFPSVQAGIQEVAERLSNHPLYKGKTMDEKLRTYNFRPEYGKVVRKVMLQLATEPL